MPRMADEESEMGDPMQVPRPPPGVGKRVPTRRPGVQTSTESDPDDESEEEPGQQGESSEEDEDEEPDWRARAQAAYLASTSFADQNYRRKLEDSLRAFNNQHPSDSKYNSETFRKRSNLYRPKIRTVIRKNEAALCAALFSNLDLIECTPANPSDQNEIVSAEVMQQVLQERLTVTMPWFQFTMGSIQDASTQGWVVAHSYWKHSAYMRRSSGEYTVREDKPCQELVPLENFLFDPSASWFDIVGTSPYLIHAIPMYVESVKERMRMPDPKGRKWHFLDEESICALGIDRDQNESTRGARTGMAEDATQQQRGVRDYDVVWVFRHIHKWHGEDYEFYMLGTKHMLTDPEPLEDNVWFGERPYVVGTCMIETHRPIPNSLATVLRPLADEANDLQNQFSDNMKFILNKAWFVKRAANVDTTSLVRNVPGRVTMVNDPEKDVKEVTWQDLPQSAMLEKNRNDQDFDSLAGNFNPMMLQSTRNPRESYRTVNAVQSPAMMMTEYTLMTLVQTFLLPCLRQLVLMEQHYETDQTILALAGQRAQIMQKFGVSEVTDAILEKKMSVNVNLGMGATDPTMKLQRLISVLTVITNLQKAQLAGVDMQAIRKELFALAGYRDAMRFLQENQDPKLIQMQKMVQLLTQKLQAAELEKRNKHESNVVKLRTSREANETKLLLAAHTQHHEDQHLLVGHLMDLDRQSRAHEQGLEAGAAQAAQQQQVPPPGAAMA